MSSDGAHCITTGDDAHAHCITCSDEGIRMRVSRMQEDGQATCIDAGGVTHWVLTELLDSVRSGDAVLVHAGVAIARL